MYTNVNRLSKTLALKCPLQPMKSRSSLEI